MFSKITSGWGWGGGGREIWVNQNNRRLEPEGNFVIRYEHSCGEEGTLATSMYIPFHLDIADNT